MSVVVGTTEELRRALGDVRAGAVIELLDGGYQVRLRPTCSLTLRAAEGADDVRLLGDGGPVVRVQDDDLDVLLHGLQISGGQDRAGGGVQVTGFSNVVLDSCTLRANRASDGPGGACYVAAGSLTLRNCVIRANPAVGGVAVVALDVGTLRAIRTEVQAESVVGGAAVLVRGGAEAILEGCTVMGGSGAGLRAAGTSSARPDVSLDGCDIEGAPSLDLRSEWAPRVTVKDGVLRGETVGVYKPVGQIERV